MHPCPVPGCFDDVGGGITLCPSHALEEHRAHVRAIVLGSDEDFDAMLERQALGAAKVDRQRIVAAGRRLKDMRSRWRDDIGTPYGQAVAQRIFSELQYAQSGGRNNALNAAAYSLARWCAGGELNPVKVRDLLHEAGKALGGMTPDQITATVRSGFTSGLKAEPQSAPDRNAA